jgi:Na+/melibiose symporter-like transporter
VFPEEAMAEERTSPAATRFELYSVASSLCVLLFMVLVASGKGEDHWLRFVTMWVVVVTQILYLIALLVSRPTKPREKERQGDPTPGG